MSYVRYQTIFRQRAASFASSQGVAGAMPQGIRLLSEAEFRACVAVVATPAPAPPEIEWYYQILVTEVLMREEGVAFFDRYFWEDMVINAPETRAERAQFEQIATECGTNYNVEPLTLYTQYDAVHVVDATIKRLKMQEGGDENVSDGDMEHMRADVCFEYHGVLVVLGYIELSWTTDKLHVYIDLFVNTAANSMEVSKLGDMGIMPGLCAKLKGLFTRLLHRMLVDMAFEADAIVTLQAYDLSDDHDVPKRSTVPMAWRRSTDLLAQKVYIDTMGFERVNMDSHIRMWQARVNPLVPPDRLFLRNTVRNLLAHTGTMETLRVRARLWGTSIVSSSVHGSIEELMHAFQTTSRYIATKNVLLRPGGLALYPVPGLLAWLVKLYTSTRVVQYARIDAYGDVVIVLHDVSLRAGHIELKRDDAGIHIVEMTNNFTNDRAASAVIGRYVNSKGLMVAALRLLTRYDPPTMRVYAPLPHTPKAQQRLRRMGFTDSIHGWSAVLQNIRDAKWPVNACIFVPPPTRRAFVGEESPANRQKLEQTMGRLRL